MLKLIVSSLNEPVIVVTFDAFGNAVFETRIISEVSCLPNVMSIRQDFSYNNKGLQFADNVVGVIRKHLAGSDNNNYFEIIKTKVQQLG
ncbi:MAG: hypothetical protein Q4C20_10200 [Erysipelotrichaceae bacterium]|nr:hypothetical protein [Erysipelotrichaceae bacterium]